jgi:hypothetical protein
LTYSDFLAIVRSLPAATPTRTEPMKTPATQQQLDTLRNLAAVAERQGFAESAQCGFISYNKARIGQAFQEEVNARIHCIREILRTSKGSLFADSIA